MTEYILYAWGLYYFIRKTNFKRFKATWINCFKGFILMLFGKMIAVFLGFQNKYDMDVNKIDMFLGIPLVVFSIIKIAKFLNKKDKNTK
jgi:hypothetical protein